ncbi:MAG: signal peptidase II [Alphaproteobacteria bacterium]|nr:signal peptidase II [Alphaproteobacteria bacterium]
MNPRLVTIGVYIAALVAMLDQGSKWWVLNEVMKPPRIVPVTPFLNLHLTLNKGITFGLFNRGHQLTPYIFTSAAVVIMLLLLNWLIHTTSRMVAVGLSLVMGGALGNVIDRVNYGGVVDFLDFHVFGYHWYAFNIADSAIVCGVGLLLLENLVSSRKKR